MADISYLIVTLEHARYAIDTDAVLEIFSLPELSCVAQAPHDVVGLIDLRGAIVPVVDLRLRFGIPRRRYALADRVVVLAREGRVMGVIVDEVHEVRRIGAYELQPVPQYPGRGGELYIAAMASVAETIIAIVDLERLFRGLPENIPAPGDDSGTVRHVGDFHENIQPADLEVFGDRADRLRERPVRADEAGMTSLAVISLGDELFGLGLDVVLEFAECAEVALVPCSPDHIVGLINLRGDILTLVDIRGMLGLPAMRKPDDARMVVVQVGDVRIGIVVADIVDVVHVPTGTIMAADRSPEADHASASLLYQGRIVTLLDIPAIIASGALHVDDEAV